MLLGSLLCAVAMLILGFTPSVAGWFATPGSSFHGTLTIWFAVLSIYIIDFSINAVQAADRALLVDTLPSSQQERGNAWAGRMLSFGSVIGFWVGNWDLPALMPWFGRTQLQVLCVLTSLGSLAAHALTCFAVKERVLVAGPSRVDGGARRKRGVMSALKDIWENVWKLPRVVQQIVCPLFSHSFCPLTIFVWPAVLGPILRLDRLVPCPFLLDSLHWRYIHPRCPTAHHPGRYDPLRTSHTRGVPCAPLLRLDWPRNDHRPTHRYREDAIENEDSAPRRRVG